MSDTPAFPSSSAGAFSSEDAPTLPYQYARAFKPTGSDGLQVSWAPASIASSKKGDQTDGLEYVYNEEIILAVNIALATGRPLLVSGPAGSGKSSLARSVARWLGWRYYEQVITSRTQARDLQWHFDALRRLGDAQVAGVDALALIRLGDNSNYIKPGVLWWAFDPDSAARRGVPGAAPSLADPALDLGPVPEIAPPEENDSPAYLAHDPRKCAVVLLDEIDKADPDVPNDLLIPLGSFHFTVEETHASVALPEKKRSLLIIITTNGERELPGAFRRRCLTLMLSRPASERLVQIARCHFGEDDVERYQAIAQLTLQIQQGNEYQAQPGTAEFLDAVKACRELNIQPNAQNSIWPAIMQATLLKGSRKEGALW